MSFSMGRRALAQSKLAAEAEMPEKSKKPVVKRVGKRTVRIVDLLFQLI
jgi:hypothetical protein